MVFWGWGGVKGTSEVLVNVDISGGIGEREIQ